MKTKIYAVLGLISEANHNRNSVAGYLRVIRWTRILELTEDELNRVLYQLEYCADEIGTRQPWLIRDMAKKGRMRNLPVPTVIKPRGELP